MVCRANRYFQNLKTKGILSVFRLAKGDYSSRELESMNEPSGRDKLGI